MLLRYVSGLVDPSSRSLEITDTAIYARIIPQNLTSKPKATLLFYITSDDTKTHVYVDTC